MSPKKTAFLVAGITVACSPAPSSPEPAESASPARPAEQAEVVPRRSDDDKQGVIAVIQTRDHRLAIHAGQSGPTFSVALQDGRVLGRDLDERALRERYESLFEIYRSGYARGGPYLDARVEPRARPVVDSRLEP